MAERHWTVASLTTWCALMSLPIFADAAQRVGEVTHPAVTELSGIVPSSFPGVYWIHNDSGDVPRLFAIRADGSMVRPRGYANFPADDWPGFAIDNAFHHDWEDIAIADGMLYVADVGNNENARRDLGIYLIAEPNPLYVTRVRAMSFVPIRYPDQQRFPAEQWHFDCEAIFWSDGRLYFLTKHRMPNKAVEFDAGAKLYRLNSMHTDRENVLELVDTNDAVTLVTAADVSPDGRRLAVLTYARLWIFEKPRRGDRWLSTPARIMDFDWDTTAQIEAVGWESNDALLMTNEGREIFRILVSDLIAPKQSNAPPHKALQPWMH